MPTLRTARTRPRPQPSPQRRQDENQRPGFAHEKTLVLGVIQLLSGAASIILATVTIAAEAWGYVVGTGVWSGVFFIVTGITGIITSKRKDNCMIISFMVLSIISAGISAILSGFSIAGLFMDHREVGTASKENVVQVMVVHSLVLLIGLIEGICAIVSAVICCRAVCCGVYDSYHAGRLMSGANPETVRFLPNTNRLSVTGDQQPIALITPTSASQQSGLFSFQGAYIIQPAEVGNQQVMYMLPASGSYPVHPAPPPPYSSTDALDSNTQTTTSVTSVPVAVGTTQSLASHPTATSTTESGSATLPHAGITSRPRPTSRHMSTSTSSIDRMLTHQDNTVSSTTCGETQTSTTRLSSDEREAENNARNRSESQDSSPAPQEERDITISIGNESEEDKP